MNPSTAQARVLVDELVRGGVRDAVLSPGSRNAALSYALAEADTSGRLRLHVRIDERSAGFLAVGLARASGAPVVVSCTSGTAVANLHPALLEASHGGVPVVALTADRPPELRGTGANQTTEQPGIYGGTVRYAVDLGVAESRAGAVSSWRTTVCRALAAATGPDPGPVHLNVPFREPLLPDGDATWVEPLDGRPGAVPWVAHDHQPVAAPTGRREAPRTLVVAGDVPLRGRVAEQVAALASCTGWPIVAEPSSGAAGPAVLRAGTWLLGVDAWLTEHLPERVVVVGRPTLSRAVAALLRNPAVTVDLLPASPRWSDPGHIAARVRMDVLPSPDQPFDESWAAAWRAADDAVAAVVDRVLDEAWPTGLRVARDVVAGLPVPSTLVVASSAPVRDVDLTACVPTGVQVVANRGLAGIDGLVSTAVGAALGSPERPAYALLGDLAFLHDVNGLVLGPDEPRPDLTIVVVDNDGGAIFGLLEQGAPEHAAVFERVFGTPHGTDVAGLCAGYRTPCTTVTSPDELTKALAPAPGVRVVHVRTDRSGDRALHERLRAAVADALGTRS